MLPRIPLALSRRDRDGCQCKRSRKNNPSETVSPPVADSPLQGLMLIVRDLRDMPAQQAPATFICYAIAYRRPPLRHVAAGG